MVHDTAARKSARKLKTEAQVMVAEALALAEMAGMELEAKAREAQATNLRREAESLRDRARLEDLSVTQEPLVRQTQKGERTYYRWVASWREAGRCRKVYLGSCRKMSQPEALQKAKGMKAETLHLLGDQYYFIEHHLYFLLMYRRNRIEFNKVDLKYRILYFVALITTVSIAAFTSFIPDGKHDFISQAPSLIAETAISIIVTIFIIDKILKDDKKKDRVHTYEALSNAICRIAYYATQNLEAPILTETEDERQIRSQLLGTICNNTNTLRKDVSNAIEEIANRTYDEIEKRRKERVSDLRKCGNEPGMSEGAQKKWKEFRKLDNQIAVNHFKKIDRQLFEIRIVLIPRALTLSNSQELSDALLRFEDILRSYESILVACPEMATTSNLRSILLEASKAYDALIVEHEKEKD